MSEKSDIQIAAEKAAETFNLNLKRSGEAISFKCPKIDVEQIYEMPEIAGMNLDYLMNENVNGINVITKKIEKVVKEFETDFDTLCIEACTRVNVDPDVLIKQAKLIADLRNALDFCGVQIVGAPFRDYMKVLEENARLKETIRMLTGVDDYDEQFT